MAHSFFIAKKLLELALINLRPIQFVTVQRNGYKSKNLVRCHGSSPKKLEYSAAKMLAMSCRLSKKHCIKFVLIFVE